MDPPGPDSPLAVQLLSNRSLCTVQPVEFSVQSCKLNSCKRVVRLLAGCESPRVLLAASAAACAAACLRPSPPPHHTALPRRSPLSRSRLCPLRQPPPSPRRSARGRVATLLPSLRPTPPPPRCWAARPPAVGCAASAPPQCDCVAIGGGGPRASPSWQGKEVVWRPGPRPRRRAARGARGKWLPPLQRAPPRIRDGAGGRSVSWRVGPRTGGRPTGRL